MATRNIAIACQGGGSFAAFTAGVLPALMPQFENVRAAQSGLDMGERTPTQIPMLVGLSGTSGGAISALLGWFGFITGGAPEAQRLLDDFWAKNSTRLPGEYWSNFLSRELSNSFSYFADVKYSPYTVPLEPLQWFFTRIWPRIATDANPFIRPDYFQLEQMLAPSVHFGLIQAFGAFASIPSDVDRWMERELEASIFAEGSAKQLGVRQAQAALAKRISEHVESVRTVRDLFDELHLPAHALLRAAFDHWTGPPVSFDAQSLLRLSAAVKEVTRYIPTLLIGAVELRHGDFTTFSSECPPDSGGITVDSVLASAALPWLVRAQRVRRVDPESGEEKWLSYWDGLFSQNPPIKNFMTGLSDERKKPDKLWIVQITPNLSGSQPGRRRDFPDRFLEAGSIWEVRNTLAGNISLNQEVSFVEAINRRVAASADTGDDDKPVQIDRIILDADAVRRDSGLALGPHSKMDRDDRLKDALVAHGRQQAQRFLALRSDLGRMFGKLDAMLAAVPQDHEGAPAEINGVEGSVWVEELVLHRMGEALPYNPQAKIRWRSVDAMVNGTPVRLEGQGELCAEPNPGTDWKITDVTITCMESLDGHAARRLAAADAAKPLLAPVDMRSLRRTDRPPQGPVH